MVFFRFNNIPDACCTKRTGSEENSRIFDQEDEERRGYVLSLQDLNQVQDTSYLSWTSTRWKIRPLTPWPPPGGFVLSLQNLNQLQDTSYNSRTSTRYRLRLITPGPPPGGYVLSLQDLHQVQDTSYNSMTSTRLGYVLSLQDLHQVQDTSYHSRTSTRYRIRPITPGPPPGTIYVL